MGRWGVHGPLILVSLSPPTLRPVGGRPPGSPRPQPGPPTAAKCVGTWGYSKEYLNNSNQTQEFPIWQQQQPTLLPEGDQPLTGHWASRLLATHRVNSKYPIYKIRLVGSQTWPLAGRRVDGSGWGLQIPY
jgi:hypothetical protein